MARRPGRAYTRGMSMASITGAFILAAGALPPADYKPAPLSDPVHLAAFLPEPLLDEDAGPDYVKLLSTHGGMMHGPVGAPSPPTPEQAALIDSALRKRRSTFGLRLVAPGASAFLSATAVKIKIQLSASAWLVERYKAASERKDWAQAEIEARRLVLLGWHYAQDWDLSMQGLGLTTASAAVIHCRAAARELGRRDPANELAARRVPADLLAYSPRREIADEIARDAGDPAKLPGLLARVEDARQRRAYAVWTLLSVATMWSPQEKAARRPGPARRAFFRRAAALGDPAVRAYAESFEAVLTEAERELAGTQAPTNF